MKASLILSYEYLRLYVNAFAYQATLNRMVAQVQAASANGQQLSSPAYPFADVAATPDARFIYDSIDAAKSLLSTVSLALTGRDRVFNADDCVYSSTPSLTLKTHFGTCLYATISMSSIVHAFCTKHDLPASWAATREAALSA